MRILFYLAKKHIKYLRICKKSSIFGRRILNERKQSNFCCTFGRRILNERKQSNFCCIFRHAPSQNNKITILGGCRSFRKRKDAPPTEVRSHPAGYTQSWVFLLYISKKVVHSDAALTASIPPNVRSR